MTWAAWRPWSQRLQPVALGLVCLVPWLLIVGRGAAGAALAAVALLFLVRAFLERDWAWLTTPWVVVALALWVYMMSAGLAAPDAKAALSRALPWLRFIVFAAALQHWVLAPGPARRWLVLSTGAAIVFVAVNTLAQYATGTSFTGVARSDPVRLSGPFANLVTGTYLVKLLFPVAVPLLVWGAERTPRHLLAVLAGLLLVAATVLLTGERVPLFHLTLGFLMAALVIRPARPWILGAVALFGLAAVAALMGDAGLRDRLVGRSLALIGDWPASPYGVIARTALAMWQDHWLIGVGARNFRVLCPDAAYDAFGPADVRCQLHPHHIYLEWLVETGVIGLAGFLALLALWARTFGRAWQDADRRLHLAGPVIGVVLFLWPFSPSMSFFSSWNGTVFWLALGWALAAAGEPARPR
ncbi:MAG: O-antigen ligase domain-containing protein [Alphaproteobacteria bacterium]|nr:O-antigen ligase domain-containing protein [Alphaproteobacteria bacterium]